MQNSKKTGKDREMKITLLSKPLPAETDPSKKFIQKKKKPRDLRRKGTRGPSWIG